MPFVTSQLRSPRLPAPLLDQSRVPPPSTLAGQSWLAKLDAVSVRFFVVRFCTALVAARVVTAARRLKNSTRTVVASVFSFFPTASQIALNGRVRILGHAALDLMHNWPEAIPCSPTFVADVVACSFRSAVDIRGGPRSDRCVSPVILAQSIDDRNVHANWLCAYRPSSIGQ